MEISARFADPGEVEKLETEHGYQSVEHGIGKMALPAKGIKVSDTVKLGLARFFWSKRVAVQGMEYQG